MMTEPLTLPCAASGPRLSTGPDFSGLIAFCRAREAARLRRERGEKPPWTPDPVLQGWRFSQVSPWLDKTTVRLVRAVEAAGLAGASEQWQVGLLVGLRSSSFPPLAEICADDPPVTLSKFAAHVQTILARHRRATTPAFARIGPPIRVVLEPAEAGAGIPVGRYVSIRAAFEVFAGLPWLNSFLGYLAARDLTATPFLCSPPDPDWAEPGPGARKGLARCGAPPDLDGLRMARDALAGKLSSWTFDIHDTQHALCEFHRWARASEGGRLPRMRFPGVE
jgi:hypothetical protein